MKLGSQSQSIDQQDTVQNLCVERDLFRDQTLFYKEDVRVDCAKADVVMPSLDAGDAMTFKKLNRPHHDINIENHIFGL